MKIQPKIKFNDNNLIEQPRIFGLNSIFKGLGKKVTLDSFDKKKTHQEVWSELALNTTQEHFRVENYKGKGYTMTVNGLGLCIQTDMAVLWALMSTGKNEGTMLFQDLSEILKKKNTRCQRTNKSIIEALYRLSNNTFNVATDHWSGTFQLLEIEREGYLIKYKFNERLIEFFNSGECLKQFKIEDLVSLKRATSKAIYTYIESKAFNDSIKKFEFTKDEILKICALTGRRNNMISKVKDGLIELKDAKIISSFSITAKKIIISRNFNEEIGVESKNKEAPKPKINNKPDPNVNFKPYDTDPYSIDFA